MINIKLHSCPSLILVTGSHSLIFSGQKALDLRSQVPEKIKLVRSGDSDQTLVWFSYLVTGGWAAKG
jgi:hypothetical protein